MKHYKIQQNTEEWMQLRSGKFTASMFKDLFSAKTTQAYQKAIYKAVFEKLTGEQPESFSNDYMQRGHELEPVAIEKYEMETFNTVEEPGFFELNEWVGASPDGLVGTDGLIEIKCPAYNTMIDYLLTGKVPSQYKWQVQGQLYVTGRKWCDFMAFHPKLKTLIIRVERDDKMIDELAQQIELCVQEAEDIIKKLT